MTFKELGVIEPILRALEDQGYTNPTPIQQQSIPILLEGKDLLGCAQTGTGKTAAFAIPIIQHLHNERKGKKIAHKIKALVVTPTRELAIQIGESFSTYAKYTGVRNTVIFGGVKQYNQTQALKKGVDVLIATPGRLLDLMNQGFVSLRDVRFSILDEADHMLDMGFIHDIRKIVAKLPTERQSLFFSATMPPAIIDLSGKILGNPEKVTIKPSQATAEKVEQAVYFVSKSNKTKLLLHLLKTNPVESTLVFSRTKHGCDKIVRHLKKAEILAEAIHGNKSQAARQRALKNFKEGKTDVLVATDIAARGIDVAELAMVIQNDLPTVAETYVHRIGRTGRAKASGIAISFCNLEEKEYLRKIEKLINQQIPVISEHPFNDDGIEHSTEKPVKVKQQQGRSSSRRNSRFGGGNRNPGGGKNSNSSNRSKGNRKWSKPPKKG